MIQRATFSSEACVLYLNDRVIRDIGLIAVMRHSSATSQLAAHDCLLSTTPGAKGAERVNAHSARLPSAYCDECSNCDHGVYQFVCENKTMGLCICHVTQCYL